MKSESKNIAIYAYLSFKHLMNLHFSESIAYMQGALLRTYEALTSGYQKNKVTCSFCNWQGPCYRTFVASTVIRRNAICPRCLSLERHREFLDVFKIVASAIQSKPIKLLDIAPSYAFSQYCLANENIDYLSIDLISQFAMLHMNLENLQLESNTFDIIVCYHVLDYLNNDVKGMNEIQRVLKNNGITITQEGIDYNINDTIEWKHAKPENEYRVRQYGLDFFERWQSANFKYFIIKDSSIGSPIFISQNRTNTIELENIKKFLLEKNITTTPIY